MVWTIGLCRDPFQTSGYMGLSDMVSDQKGTGEKKKGELEDKKNILKKKTSCLTF